MKTFTAKENSTLKNFTDCTFPQGSFCLSSLLKNKDVKVNGVRVKCDVPLFCGDEVTYYTTPEQEKKPSHAVVYEDENILVCDKFSGVSSEGLCNELGAFAVHRLDRNTQGLIVFAKNEGAQEELTCAFRQRRVIKTYLALCKNCFKCEGETLVSYLKKDESSATVKIFDRETAGAVKIITEYSVLQKRGDIALVSIVLHTGKTHQIRAHMAHIGCPVMGDTKYGDKALNKKYGKTRQQLISKSLEFCLEGKLSYLNGKKFISSFQF